jgi:hypothetical protein
VVVVVLGIVVVDVAVLVDTVVVVFEVVDFVVTEVVIVVVGVVGAGRLQLLQHGSSSNKPKHSLQHYLLSVPAGWS